MQTLALVSKCIVTNKSTYTYALPVLFQFSNRLDNIQICQRLPWHTIEHEQVNLISCYILLICIGLKAVQNHREGLVYKHDDDIAPLGKYCNALQPTLVHIVNAASVANDSADRPLYVTWQQSTVPEGHSDN